MQRDRILGLYRDRGAAVTVSIEFPTGAVLTQTLEPRVSRTAVSQAAPARPASHRQAGQGADGGRDGEHRTLQALKAVAVMTAMAVAAVIAVMAATSAEDDGGKGDGYVPGPGSSSWGDGTRAPGSLLDPKDDRDGDGWVDDPCPDRNVPLAAEC